MRISPEQASVLDRIAEAHLTERERKVIWLLYGLDDGEARTPEEVGSLFGVTREVVLEIRSHAFLKLRGVPELEASGVLREMLRNPPPEFLESLKLLIDPGNATPEELANLYTALSDLYRAYGGSGLVFRSHEDVRFLSGVLLSGAL